MLISTEDEKKDQDFLKKNFTFYNYDVSIRAILLLEFFFLEEEARLVVDALFLAVFDDSAMDSGEG